MCHVESGGLCWQTSICNEWCSLVNAMLGGIGGARGTPGKRETWSRIDESET